MLPIGVEFSGCEGSTVCCGGGELDGVGLGEGEGVVGGKVGLGVESGVSLG